MAQNRDDKMKCKKVVMKEEKLENEKHETFSSLLQIQQKKIHNFFFYSRK